MKKNQHYDPPEDELLKEAYDNGYEAYRKGKSENDNPYKQSGHERDTTFDDERHFQWTVGFWDAQDN